MARLASRPNRVAILGGGPTGNTLATFLSEKGADVTVFSAGKRPSLIVGESVIPALVPLFQRLGIEDEVAAISQLKPGVTIRYPNGEELFMNFRLLKGLAPTYAYNVPRPGFDEILDRRAQKAGARLIPARAQVIRGTSPDREVELSPATVALVPEWNGGQPDLIIDATGRTRSIAKLLDLPVKVGPRNDVAYFAHYRDFEAETPQGLLLLSPLQPSGWSWRIPLPGRMSVGVVLNKEVAAGFGQTSEERLEAVIDSSPDLRARGASRHRISEVLVYTNYQLISARGHGPGWIAAGDAFGFVDPMLSSGLYLAMWSAEELSKAIPVRAGAGFAKRLAEYEAKVRLMIQAWHYLIDRFYDGTLFAAYAAGKRRTMQRSQAWIAPLVARHFTRMLAGMMCGATTNQPYCRHLLRLLTTRGLEPADVAAFAIG
jgi:flavin-dependent dehydrogenase